MADNDRNPKTPTKWSRVSRTASFWLLMVLIPVLIVQFASPNRKESLELTYSAFDNELQRGNVEHVTIIDGKRVEGALRGEATIDKKKVKDFWTLLPFKDSDAL